MPPSFVPNDEGSQMMFRWAHQTISFCFTVRGEEIDKPLVAVEDGLPAHREAEATASELWQSSMSRLWSGRGAHTFDITFAASVFDWCAKHRKWQPPAT
jgi:hypothetical protein